MPFLPRPEVVQAFALWLYRQDFPEVPDWEAEERHAAAKDKPADQREHSDARTEYEERARKMLMIARGNSGSGG